MAKHNVENPHLTCNIFEAWVSVGDKALTQYAPKRRELDDDFEASCWIASDSDQPFSIFYQKKAIDNIDYQIDINLDGINVLCRLKTHKSRSRNAVMCISTVRTSSEEVRNFTFGSIDTTDEDASIAHNGHDVGEIVVSVKKVKIDRETKQRNTKSYDWRSIKVDERSSKGLTHQIRLGNTIASKAGEASSSYIATPYGGGETLRFRYRPLAFLQANGISPRPSLPAAAEPEYIEIPDSPEPPSELADDEGSQTADMDAREKALLAELERLQKERAVLAELEQIRLAKRAAALAKDKRPNKRAKTEVKSEVKAEL
ncbi:hypothetical protein HYPSUDRAFT_48915 [Hypholoma sublateritium FD-334 SS-4]|uniref:DUF7918 domain-containing protein n=1 Tax=Hypholoma sublateritium (strain FD-334 SS-4) TaxID=945553 RepID=A0A0D2KJ92_HYPSF|nr:hypothetical protein HYPSUDRAFT_48915 [Hypholoma sublateritium FD-334 SS-4]